MRINTTQQVLLVILAIVFAVALTYASVELPRRANAILHDLFDFPNTDPVRDPESFGTFIASNHLHVIGYSALILLVFIVIVGVAAERKGLATAGAIGIFLPVFGHFCRSMFFLAGLGLLRTMWLPITNASFDVLRLGEIVYVPYAIVVYLAALAGHDIRNPLPYIIMGFGTLVFVLGVLAWFMTRFRKVGTADFWVYRVSRHPQYVGWIVWSYGLMIYFTRYNEGTHFKLAWGFPDSLPFLLSAVVIVGVALIEEIRMRREHGPEYKAYSERTPFLLPLPRVVSNAIATPMRLIIRKDRPETGREVLMVLGAYAAILILLSVPFVVFHWPPRGGWWAFPYNVTPFS